VDQDRWRFAGPFNENFGGDSDGAGKAEYSKDKAKMIHCPGLRGFRRAMTRPRHGVDG
jgi:hypothetical protein